MAELNREQIEHTLEICSSGEGATSTEREVFCMENMSRELASCVLALVRELTEENERLTKQCGEIILACDERDAERLKQVAKLENEVRQTRQDIDGLRHYIRLNEDIAIQHKREGRPETEEYWKGKVAAFAQIEGYIRCEICKVRSLEE